MLVLLAATIIDSAIEIIPSGPLNLKVTELPKIYYLSQVFPLPVHVFSFAHPHADQWFNANLKRIHFPNVHFGMI